MFKPTEKSPEQPQLDSLKASIAHRAIEHVIDSSSFDTSRSKRSRMIALTLLKEYEDRGNKL